MGFQSYILGEVTSQLPELRNQTNAADMQWYMKDIAPFLGIKTPIRRDVLKKIFKEAPLSGW